MWTCKAGMHQPWGPGCPCPAGLSHSAAPCPGLWQGPLSFQVETLGDLHLWGCRTHPLLD